jgi:hypothetical protein
MDALRLANTIRGMRIPHPHYERAQRETLAHATITAPGSVIALIGPTRVGKTSILESVARSAFPIAGQNEIPAICIDAATTDRGYMSTRYLSLRCLQALQHPFYSESSYLSRNPSSETVLRVQLIRAIAHRRTKLIFVDEAHHLLRVRERRAAGAALDTIKCIGNETGAVIVLAGGYELLGTCFESAHLNGRLTLVHFPRYKPVEADLQHFDRILCTFDKHLPWTKALSLYSLRQLIHGGTAGCCGLLSGWIQAALARMHATGDSKLKREHFLLTRFREQLDPILEEICTGERLLTQMECEARHIAAPDGRTKRRYRPGLRKPTRDPVGRGKRE